MVKVINNEKMSIVANLAFALLTKHNLNNWTFRFDHAKSRAGLCICEKKIISLSIYYVEVSSTEQIQNTILHEIAHALVGHRQGHNHIWRAKALEIGSDARRCHDQLFVVPKWVMQCPNGCFSIFRHRKKRHLLCKSCHIPVVYEMNNV